MGKSTLNDNTNHKKIGRPVTTGKGELIGVRLHEPAIGDLDAWIASHPEPRPTRPEAIRRLLGEAFGNQETAAHETDAVAVELSAPATSKSEDLLRAAILALADEIANDPDDVGNYFDGYEARVRQVASSPSISQQSLINFVDGVFNMMNKTAKRRRKG
jgi:hypothetical protein